MNIETEEKIVLTEEEIDDAKSKLAAYLNIIKEYEPSKIKVKNETVFVNIIQLKTNK